MSWSDVEALVAEFDATESFDSSMDASELLVALVAAIRPLIPPHSVVSQPETVTAVWSRLDIVAVTWFGNSETGPDYGALVQSKNVRDAKYTAEQVWRYYTGHFEEDWQAYRYIEVGNLVAVSLYATWGNGQPSEHLIARVP